jgi:hypothetical protein
MAKKAPAKSVTGDDNNLNTIIELHTEINEMTTQLKDKKAEFLGATDKLRAESRTDFDADLGDIRAETPPEVFGNHEYTTTEGRVVTVNYRMQKGGLSFSQIGKRPAHEVLPELIDEKEYKKLFVESKVLKESDAKLDEVHDYRPDLVNYSLDVSKLSDKALETLRDAHPDAFIPYVVDVDTYIKEIESATVETEVHTATGFISKVSQLSEDSRLKLKDFLRKVLGAKATSAVKVGNKVS